MTTVISAHEYILLAESFFLERGQTLELHLFVADGFNVEAERVYQKSMTKGFILFTEDGQKDLKKSSEQGDIPILEMKVDFEGLGLITMERNYAQISLPTDRFKSYVKGDNIENVVVDESKPEQKEKYLRFIKTLVQSNPKKGDDLYSKKVGHQFEIVLLQNPYELTSEDWISAQVFFNGRPLANKAITARNRTGNEPATYQYSRTDQDGVCSFKLERGGEWFIHATHMIPNSEGDTDWISFWTSYSFGMK